MLKSSYNIIGFLLLTDLLRSTAKEQNPIPQADRLGTAIRLGVGVPFSVAKPAVYVYFSAYER